MRHSYRATVTGRNIDDIKAAFQLQCQQLWGDDADIVMSDFDAVPHGRLQSGDITTFAVDCSAKLRDNSDF